MYIFAYGDPRDWNMKNKNAKDEESAQQCGESKSCLEIFLITLLVLLIASVCAFFSYIIIITVQEKCITADCIKQTAWIQSILPKEVDPCDDFYKFVCPLNKNESKYGKIKETSRRLKVIVEKQIEKLMRGRYMVNEDDASKVLKRMYRACFDVENPRRYLDEVYSAVIDWGLLERNTTYFDWFKFIEKAREYGLAYDLFLDVSVVENVIGNGEPILRIGPPYTLPEDIAQSIDEIVFLGKLKEITEKGLSSNTSEIMTIKEFEDFYDFSPWSLIPNFTTNALQQTILVAATNYFSELLDLLQETEEGIIKYFMQRHILKEIFDEYLEWTKFKNPESYCTMTIKTLLPQFTQIAYMKNYLTKETLEEAKIIATNIKHELIQTLKNANWLNIKTKNYILNKIANVTFVIGAPDAFLANEFNALHDALSIVDVDNFLLMTLKAKKHTYHQQYSTLKKEKYLIKKFSEAILSIYSFYSFKHNLIVVPAAVLQNPIFYLKRPRYLNYGLLGAIMGRELMRAFIRFAKESDEECLDVDWSWILRQIQCLEEQYSSYNYSDVPMYRIVKGEQIFADVAGTKLAYFAYLNRMQVYEMDRALFGLNFTANQLFWIAKGVHACYFLETYSANNPALSYMVMSPFMNLNGFSDDFVCYKDKFLVTQQCNVL